MAAAVWLIEKVIEDLKSKPIACRSCGGKGFVVGAANAFATECTSCLPLRAARVKKIEAERRAARAIARKGHT